MKKIILLVVVLSLVLTMSSCGGSDLELSDFAEAYVEAGYEVDLEIKGFYGLYGAVDAFVFWLGDEKVIIFEYESSKMARDRETTHSFAAVNGRFGIESESEEAIEIFKNVK